jgi:ATP-binding cassette, subfamily A (ABC1), member 3
MHTLRDLIRSCDLEEKTHALAKTLSGGQKRKLQLAMMFTAGSQICCVDEVSSGLDPQSRRKIWETLLAKRGECTIVLTTHFLDEVDYLADHVIVISQGSIRAEGSAVDLKQRWGGGYSVHVAKAPDHHQHGQAESSNTPEPMSPQETISVDRSSDVTQVVDGLEARAITDYRITGPTIENAFFNVLGESLPPDDVVTDNDLDRRIGKTVGLFRSVGILLSKRLIILRRNLVPHLLAIVIAPIVAGAASIFLNNYNGLFCGSNLPLTNSTIYTPSSLHSLDFVLGPSSQISLSVLERVAAFIGDGAAADLSSFTQSLHLVESIEEFNQYIGNHQGNVTPGGVFLGSDGSSPTFAYHANGPLYHSVFTQNVLDILTTNVSTTALFSELSSANQVRLSVLIYRRHADLWNSPRLAIHCSFCCKCLPVAMPSVTNFAGISVSQ